MQALKVIWVMVGPAKNSFVTRSGYLNYKPQVYLFLFSEETLDCTAPSSLGKKHAFLPAADHSPIYMYHGITGPVLHKFYRLRSKSGVVFSLEYGKAKKTNTCTILLTDNSFAMVLYFVSSGEDNYYAFVEKLIKVEPCIRAIEDQRNLHDLLERYRATNICHHIQRVRHGGQLDLVAVDRIQKRCVYMNMGQDKVFVSIPPNFVEHC